jgi:hypothetical protein
MKIVVEKMYLNQILVRIGNNGGCVFYPDPNFLPHPELALVFLKYKLFDKKIFLKYNFFKLHLCD